MREPHSLVKSSRVSRSTPKSLIGSRRGISSGGSSSASIATPISVARSIRVSESTNSPARARCSRRLAMLTQSPNTKSCSGVGLAFANPITASPQCSPCETAARMPKSRCHASARIANPAWISCAASTACWASSCPVKVAITVSLRMSTTAPSCASTALDIKDTNSPTRASTIAGSSMSDMPVNPRISANRITSGERSGLSASLAATSYSPLSRHAGRSIIFFVPVRSTGVSNSQLRTGNPQSRRPGIPARNQDGGQMAVRIGDEAPDFTAETTEGKISFHEWIGDKWAILFSHPKDFTPVCTTELGYMAKLKPEFDKRNTKIIGLSIDPVSDHNRWVNDIKETQGSAVNYPMIGDADLNVAKLYDMIHPNASGGKRTAADNATIRSVFMIGPDKKVKAMLIYPMSAGRNFDEVLRLLDSLQLNAKHAVATPVNWKPGQDVIIPTSVSDEEAKKKYPQGFKTHKPYLRTVAQPK